MKEYKIIAVSQLLTLKSLVERATINLLSEGGLHTKSEYLQNGKWVDGHEIYYKEAPDAKVLFK